MSNPNHAYAWLRFWSEYEDDEKALDPRSLNPRSRTSPDLWDERRRALRDGRRETARDLSRELDRRAREGRWIAGFPYPEDAA